ncbi:sugar ABC transporter ATP-binding protein [Variovorax boronicumulans]|uniref:sugar ABC transporter ATP-binding protein n=1 Tax=Variovorax boronicumulans TaxID=436515 RepID=UPI001C59FB45
MSANTSPILTMRSITKAFNGVHAITAASLEAYAGEALAVMGANGAGKSTLMNILGGVIGRDDGDIRIDGQPIDLRSPRDAARHGIAFVHQELTMFPTLSVAENIFIDNLPIRHGLIDLADMRRQSQALLVQLGCDIAPTALVEQLSIGDRQLVEIARALRSKARIIIFDEPTSSLSGPERERLFEVVRSLKASGVVVLYITHFLDEIFRVCERLTVMRNGESVWSSAMSEVTPAKVVHLMLGVTENEGRMRAPRQMDSEGRPPLLSVRGMGREGALRDVNFELRHGEIVGLWGLLGSGRTELLRSLVGLDPLDTGALQREGQPATPKQLHAHVGLVTEDRRGEGLLLPQSIAENIGLPSLTGLRTSVGLVDRAQQNSLADRMIERLRIKVSSRDQAVGTLSGGNQQKVVFSRWLATQPKIFLLDEPTRGLDVSAKTEIMKLIVELAEQGCSVLLVSSELQELMRVCDRYLVIRRGRLVQELPGTADTAELMDAVSTLDSPAEIAA